VSSEHWFDRLSRPHSRRTALKAALAAGAALTLPASRLADAWATPTEPCFKPCQDAATAKWSTDESHCTKTMGANFAIVGASASQSIGLSIATVYVIQAAGFYCLADAEITWHRSLLACRGSECGNPAKYPGGQKPRPPAPKCDPTLEIVCGDTCCHHTAECCSCKSAGAKCCAAGACDSCCR
jgi:hypothetical protein